MALSIAPLYCSKAKINPIVSLLIAVIGGALFTVGYLSQIDAETGGKVLNVPFYDFAIIDAKLGGVLAMFGAIVMLVLLPWLDRHPVKSARFRPLFRVAVIIFVINFIVLGVVGAKPAEGIWPLIGLATTGLYYAFFLFVCPYLTKYERAKPLPESINQAILDENKK